MILHGIVRDRRFSCCLSVSLITLLVWTTSIAQPAFGEDDWPAFRGPNGNGIVAARTTAEQWSPDEHITWRSELPGQGWSSPVIGEGKIYLTAAIADGVNNEDEEASPDQDLCLLILSETTGKLLKKVVVMRQSAEKTPRIHTKNSHASPTPILSGDRIFVHFGYQGTACLSRDGDVVWVNRELFFKPTHGNGGSPILVENRLVFTCDGGKEPRIVALDAETGELVWQTPRPVSAKKTFSFCTPTAITVNGRQQIIAPGSDCVLALDPQSGDTIWDVRYDGYSVVPKPVFAGGIVYLSTSFDNPKILAIDPTGSGVVTDTHVRWQLDRFAPKTPSLIAYQGRVYSVSDNGILACVDASTGDIIYNERLRGNFSASPILIGDRLYLTSERGVTTVTRAGGDEFELIAKNDLKERTLASAAVSDGAIFIRTADALYRIE